MTLKQRIGELEKRTGAGKQVVIVVVYTTEVDGRRQVHPRDYTQEEYDQALASYKNKHRDKDWIVLSWKDGQFGR